MSAVLPCTARADLDVVFVLDVTGSMSGELREAKERVGQLAEALRRARAGERVRLGVVAFRDRKDAYLTKVSGLSEDVATTERFLSGLGAGGGGDYAEDVLGALAVAIRGMDWSQAERRVFLIGDAPPHLDYPDNPPPELLMAEARHERIVVDAIGCRSLSPEGQVFFRDFAYGTEGRYQHIGHVHEDTAGVTASVLGSLTGARAPVPKSWRGSQREGVPTSGEVFEARWVEPGCRFHLELPDGLGLLEAPDLAPTDGSTVIVRARVGPHAPGGGRFRVEPCFESDTQLQLRLTGGEL